jgi:hypothetical protein
VKYIQYRRSWLSYWTILSLVWLPTVAWGLETKNLPPDKEEKLLPKEMETERAAPSNRGWVPRLTLGTTIAFAHSDRVVGAQDGQTWNIGPAMALGLDYFQHSHEWRNNFSLHEVFTRTPVIDEFVKTTDRVFFETLYLYHLESVPWLGPYAQVRAETSIFSGKDIREKTTTYQIKGDSDTFESAHVDLTKPFSPTRLKEIAGVFATPIDSQSFTLEFRIGVGAQQIWVRNGLVIEDKKTTPLIELRRMNDFQQFGAEVMASIKGTLMFDDLGRDRPLGYEFTGGLLTPFYSSRRDGRSIVDLMGFEVDGKITIRLFEWASLDYVIRVVRAPLIVDALQIQHNLLLGFTYALKPGNPGEETPPKDPVP